MNLYLLKRSDHVYYDEARGFVVAAESPEDARTLVIPEKGDEDVLCWVRCEPVLLATGADVARGVVLRDFVSG